MEHNIKYFFPLDILQFLGPPAYKKISSLPPHTPKTSSTSACFFTLKENFTENIVLLLVCSVLHPFDLGSLSLTAYILHKMLKNYGSILGNRCYMLVF